MSSAETCSCTLCSKLFTYLYQQINCVRQVHTLHFSSSTGSYLSLIYKVLTIKRLKLKFHKIIRLKLFILLCFNFKNLRNSAKYKFLKLPEDDTDVSKHVGVTIIFKENIAIYICPLVGCNLKKNNIKMHDTVIKKTNMFIFSSCLLFSFLFQSSYIKVKHKCTYMNQLLSRFITTSGPTTNLRKLLKFMFPLYYMEFHQYHIQLKQELLRM